MCSCVVLICVILGGFSGMLVDNRLEVIMVHNLPITVFCSSFKLCSNQTYMDTVLQSVERGGRGKRGVEGEDGERRGRVRDDIGRKPAKCHFVNHPRWP